MAKVDKDKFLQLLQQSGLVDDDRLQSALDRIASENEGQLPGDSSDPGPLANALIEAEIVTRWQADLLTQGKHKGFVIGKYKLLQHLGSGGMSSVYLAEHMTMKHKVAIKVLPRSKVEDSSYLQRFINEARAAARMQHPNIARAHDIDHEGKTHYIVMDYVAGTNLQTLIKENGTLDYETAADYMAQAAEGLQFAHENGLVHRDIKPANLLVDSNGMLKILDLGLALFSDEDASLTRDHDENVLGTADYLAPEQAFDSHRVDRRADIYSLGCTLYYLLTGHPPFPEGTLPQRLMKHQTQAPPSIYEDRPDAPPSLVNICLKMMAKTPDARYQTAAEVAHELGGFMVTAHRGSGGMPGGMPGGGISSGSSGMDSPPRKELKTRGSGSNRGTPRTRPPGSGNTISNQNSETIKSPGKPPQRKPSASGIGSRPASKRAAPPGAGLTGLDDSSGEFIFETEVFGSPAGSSLSGKKSIMDNRAARTQRRAAKLPWWIFAAMGGGVLLVAFLAYKILAGG